ncbi:ribosome-associated translation inhibitor RaiA [Candidatus Woesebacteria bacterium]|nr:ribosome-associated translation inhibitor RaiA [Candidatus Woesebacteria bacterium]
MQVIVEGKEMAVTPALQAHAEKQAKKITNLNKHVIALRMFLETIEKKSNDPMANRVTYEIDIPGHDLVVKSHAADMYEAIVKATDAARRKLRKLAEKQRDLSRKEGLAAS